jgi:isopenicillin N synthase-like dioxygenase
LFAKQLQDVCHNIGFFYIKNHGIDPNLIDSMMSISEEFFHLPLSEKNKINIATTTNFRGYCAFQKETTQGVLDNKEGFVIGVEQNYHNSTAPYSILTGPNVFPTAINMRDIILNYFDEIHKLGKELLKGVALGLGLSENYLLDKFLADSPFSSSTLKLLKYHVGCQNIGTLGIAPHTDQNFLTILLQDEVGGLQVKINDGWVDVPPIPNTFVVNLGQMLQILSNNYFLATEHCVRNNQKKPRYSYPFFLGPNLDSIICPLDLNWKCLPVRNNNQVSMTKKEVVYGDYFISELRIFRK